MKRTSILLASLALAGSLHAGFKTSESSYLTATPSSDFTFEPIVTVGDLVPRTNGSPGGGSNFAFCGIPDAMGIYKDAASGENILFCSHEMTAGTITEPFPGLTKYNGAWISRGIL